MPNRLPQDFSLHKYGLDVRFVQESDAKFILDLRKDPIKSKYLSYTSGKLEDQIIWIRDYKKREAEGSDYYFMYEYQGQSAGVNRLYHIEADHFVHGSWLFSNNVPPFCSLAAAVIAREIAYELLGLVIEIDTDGIHQDNKGVLQFAKFMGHEFIGSRITEQGDVFLTSKLKREAFYHNLPKILKLFPKKYL